MKKSKQAKLEAAGWKVGDTKEFLGLTDAEDEMILLKLELAHALKNRRTKKRLTQAELSKELGSSQSRVAKMEAGDPSVSMDLLVRSLLKLGATRADIAKCMAPSRRKAA